MRIRRLESGLYGDCESVGEGVFELRMFSVPVIGFILVRMKGILLSFYVAVIKGSQSRDIKTAKAYWKEYRENG